MLDEDYDAFDDGERTVGGIHTAVEAWLADPAAAKKDELAGVGLAFYAQIYVLKVPTGHGCA